MNQDLAEMPIGETMLQEDHRKARRARPFRCRARWCRI